MPASASVKLAETKYELAPSPCAPPAICWGDVESGKEPEQAPVAPPPPEALPQLTVTADTGTLGQPLKVLESAWTLRVQVFKFEPSGIAHERLAGEDPDTTPPFGLDA